MKTKNIYLIALAIVAATGLISCGKQSSTSSGDRTANALASYVAPGEKDEYYLFYSGGHSGQVFVAGIPSMRHITTIPVFAPYPATGYGFDEESKKMMGDYTWGDVHHPGLSQTASKYDGRWLFVNDNANNRIARIDLRDFKTHQILGPDSELDGQSRLLLHHRELGIHSVRHAVSRCLCRKAASLIQKITKRNSTAWSAASRLIRRPAK